MNLQRVVQLLKQGKIGVIPTDTIYGIVGSALISETVEKIYKLRKRSSDKPFITLISSLNDLNNFNITLIDKQREFLRRVWPNPVSVILPIQSENFKYLHRGTNSLAFRMPKDEWLLSLLKKVGPLVAPSANFEGEKPAEAIEEAKKYFADNVDFYVDGGRVKSSSSTLIQLNENGSWDVLRQGEFKV